MKKIFLTLVVSFLMLSVVPSYAELSNEAYLGLSSEDAKDLDDAINAGDEDLVADILTLVIMNSEEETARIVSDYVFSVMPEVKRGFKTTNAVAYFEFDGESIGQGDKEKLAELANSILGKGSNRLVTVTGFTDNIGTVEYNDSLSMRRAVAVRDILVEEGLSNIKLVALGERSPQTFGCGDDANLSVISCLQPERKVTVSIIPEPIVRRSGARTDAGLLPAVEPSQISGN